MTLTILSICREPPFNTPPYWLVIYFGAVRLSFSSSLIDITIKMPSHWTLIKAPLHLGHAFLLGLTFLFLLLGGITGCGKDFWWLTITYGETGLRSPEVWNIGGVKACQIGKQ